LASASTLSAARTFARQEASDLTPALRAAAVVDGVGVLCGVADSEADGPAGLAEAVETDAPTVGVGFAVVPGLAPSCVAVTIPPITTTAAATGMTTRDQRVLARRA
jgi:hypothetical protein